MFVAFRELYDLGGNMTKSEKEFDPKKYTITSTGIVKREWKDLLKSENAQVQVREAKKLSQSVKKK